MVEVLHDFHGQDMPLEWIIQLAGKQKPREFSISSSDQLYKGQKHITMAVAEYQTPFKRDIKGICSYWLAHRAEMDLVPVWMKKGTMVLPTNPETPIIMVAPGTGIAAFVSFIQHFKGSKTPLYLIFGCRSQKSDFYYSETWSEYPNLTVLPAFSRDNEDGSKKYVQHVIKESGKLFLDLV